MPRPSLRRSSTDDETPDVKGGRIHQIGEAQFLAVIADPDNPEHRDTKRWAGGHFDSDWFNREMVDKDVHNALRANRRIAQAKTKIGLANLL